MYVLFHLTDTFYIANKVRLKIVIKNHTNLLFILTLDMINYKN